MNAHATAAPIRRSASTVRRWRTPIIVTLALVAAAALYSFVAMPAILHVHKWWLNPEAFFPVYAGRFVVNGAYPWLYEGANGWIAGPLLPVVVAPVAWLQDRFHLLDNGLWNVYHPTLWLVLLPYGLAAFALVAHGARSFAAEALGSQDLEDRRLVALQWTLVIVVGIPVGIVFAHFEDLFALGLIFLACRDARGGSRRGGALWLALAIGFKQWSVLALPVLLVLQPKERRPGWLLTSLGIPAVLYGLPLAIDPSHAVPALLQGRAFPSLGHASLVVRTAAPLVGTPFRVCSVLAAIGIGVVFSRSGRRDPQAVAAALGILFLIRMAFEPSVFGYYPSPALALLAVHEVVVSGRTIRTLALGSAMLVIFPMHPDPYLWWAVCVALAVMLAKPAVPDLRRGGGAARQRTRSKTNDVLSTA